jgi:hypothetical protein
MVDFEVKRIYRMTLSRCGSFSAMLGDIGLSFSEG